MCVLYRCDSDVFWLLSTSTSLNTEVNAFRRMNYRWTWPSCPPLLWISKAVLPASPGGNLLCVSLTVGACSRGGRLKKKKYEIMMSRVVITFLPLNGGRGRRNSRGVVWGFLWLHQHHQHVYDPISSQIILICYWNKISKSYIYLVAHLYGGE